MLGHNGKLSKSQHSKSICTSSKLYLSHHDVFKDVKTRKNNQAKSQAKSQIEFECLSRTIKNSQSGTKMTFQTKTPKRYETDSTFINSTNEFANSMVEHLLKKDRAKSESTIASLRKQNQLLEAEIAMLQQQGKTQAREYKDTVSSLQSKPMRGVCVDALAKEKIRNHLISQQKEEQKRELATLEHTLAALGNQIVEFFSASRRSLCSSAFPLEVLKESLAVKMDQYQRIKASKVKLDTLQLSAVQDILGHIEEHQLQLSRIQQARGSSENSSLMDQFNTFLQDSRSLDCS